MSRTWVRVLAAAVPCILALAGCGRSVRHAETEAPGEPDPEPGAGGGSAGFVPLGEYASRLADELCQAVAPCCSAAGIAYDLATCRLVATELLAPPRTKVGENTTYDAEEAARCIEELRDVIAGCGSLVLDGGWTVNCDRVFDGTLPPEAPCRSSDECVDHGDCTDQQGGVLVCVAKAPAPRGVEMETCAGDCEDGTSCDLRLLPSDPEPLATYCYEADELYCEYGPRGQDLTPVCVHRVPLGGACSDDDGCLSGACDGATCVVPEFCFFDTTCERSHYCDSDSTACVKKKADGSSCSGPRECSSGKCGGSASIIEWQGKCGNAATPNTCTGDFYVLTAR